MTVPASGRCQSTPNSETVGTGLPTSSRGDALAQTGPVPDYAEVESIEAHESVRAVAPRLAVVLEQVLGKAFRFGTWRWPGLELYGDDANEAEDVSVMWLRDYQPVFVRDQAGLLRAVYYLSTNSNRSNHRFAPLPGALDDRTVPIVHENGNLLVSGSLVLVGEKLVTDNVEPAQSAHLIQQGYRPRDAASLLLTLAEAIEITPQRLALMPPMPFEATGHIDTYLLPVDAEHVIVPSISDEALGLIKDRRMSYFAALTIRAFLDEQARQLCHLGRTPVRLPMVAPEFRLTPEGHVGALTEEDVELLLRTPANSVLANTGVQRHVFVPKFSNHTKDPAAAALSQRYEGVWQCKFETLGWTPHFVEASELASHLGLLHCVTANIPQRDASGARRRAYARRTPSSRPPALAR